MSNWTIGLTGASDTLGMKPMEQAFSSGTLELSTEKPSIGLPSPETWQANTLNMSLVLAFTFLFLFNIRNLMSVFPSLTKCIYRWKENVNLENSMQLVRDRNIITAVLIVPFCLLADRYSIYAPDFFGLLPEGTRILGVIGVGLAFILLRKMLNMAIRPGRARENTVSASYKCGHNYFILGNALFLPSSWIMALFNADDIRIKTVLLIETALVYMLFLVRKGQILNSFCNPFATFLYLCMLEIIPAAILVVSAVLL